MKKYFFFISALFGLALLTGCEDHGTWRTNNDNRWFAGEEGSSLYGYIDQNGKMVIAANYTITYSFSCGWAAVKEDGVYKFIDRDGKSVEPDPFPYWDESGCYFYYNRIRFVENKKYGMYDENWKQVIPADYAYLDDCTADGLLVFSEDGDIGGYMDPDGKVVIEEQFYNAFSFANGIAVVWEYKNNEVRYGVIDKKGNYLIEPQKKPLYNLGEGRIAFKNPTTGKYGMMDKKGSEIVSAKYDDVWPFTCGLAVVVKNSKYGYINTKGEEVIPCRHDYADSFYEDLAGVYDDRCTIVNTKGETVLKLKEGENLMSGFINGLGLVANHDWSQWRYIDKKGETIYKWTEEGLSIKAPEKQATLQNRRRVALMSSEYGHLFRDMERAQREMKQ